MLQRYRPHMYIYVHIGIGVVVTEGRVITLERLYNFDEIRKESS